MQKGFAPLIIIVGVVLLIFLGLVIQHITGFGLPQRQNNSFSEGYRTDGNCQSKEVSKFEGEFTDLSKIDALGQIGGITGGSPGRSYMSVKKGVEAPIFSPTDATLENIVYARRGGPSTPGEYGLYIRLSCDVTLLFDHIDKVSDKIKVLAPKEPSETSKVDNPPVNIQIKKGELLGYSDGTPQARTFDFLLIDRSKPTTHINPERWQWEQAVYAQCPYDYFIPELKNKYYQKIGEVAEISGIPSFTPAENCGDLSHDKLGTISGGWFKGESTDTKGDYLAISRDGKRVDVAVKKDGLFAEQRSSASFGSDSNLRDYSPKVYPEDVSAGEEVCYWGQYENKWAYVKLESERKLIFARGDGNCPDSFPQSQFEVWER